MKIIITMAGFGNRFRQIGITQPKHEIIANGKSLFRWSLLSLSDFFDCDFYFITRAGSYNAEFIEEECRVLNIATHKIIEVASITEGQASSALLADALLKDEDEVAIFNIDTYIVPGTLLKKDIPADAYGYTPAFVAEGDKWSFVKTEGPNSLRVTEVSEKVRISNLGTIGFYYFKQWSDFRQIYAQHKEDIKAQYKETYIAPMYHYLIQLNKAVYTEVIDKDKIVVLGTPEDISLFDADYLKNNL